MLLRFHSYLAYANFSFWLYLFCLYHNKFKQHFEYWKPRLVCCYFFLFTYLQANIMYHIHAQVCECTYICMLNFASLATKSVAWAPSQHYNIVVQRPVPNSVRNLHTYEYDLKFVRMYIHMCINANKRTTRIPNYIHTYICTCIYICMYSQLHTSHKPKKIITPKKCKRREHRKQGK